LSWLAPDTPHQRSINIVQTQSDSNNINQIVNEPLSQYMTFEISRNADYSNQCRFYQDANSHINHQYYHHPSQSRNLRTEEGLANMHSQQTDTHGNKPPATSAAATTTTATTIATGISSQRKKSKHCITQAPTHLPSTNYY
jgi:hypothetical protein